ncbi:MAG TPA: 3-phosphoshikimate 1-carboxyvinyltransferase [Bacteroidia bacterium]|jgi:3-phosphoshikimate 1-carboxyvinyltransferase|nr:3-phosphoshikimate 1-carboxyvinyltransferase [Bacteroidia bacterium]
MKTVIVSHPSGIVNGIVNLPASKSIANRLLLMKAVAAFNDLEILNLSNARDTIVLNRILTDLSKNNTADVHDAGTVMRFLTAYLSCLEGEWILTGAERMQQRPIGALVDVLKKLGAEISYEKKEGYPPLKIKGKKLHGGKVEIDGSVSSQFLSALLMISPLYKEPLQLQIKNNLVSVPYVEMTLKLMQEWGAEYKWKENTITVNNKAYTKPTGKVFVESDWSAASYFYSVLSLAKEGKIIMPYLFENSLQGDSICKELFTLLSISSSFTSEGLFLEKTNHTEKKFAYNFIKCPDIAQTLAVCCAAKGMEASLAGLQTLSIKETDRISAIKTELEKFDIKVSVTTDSISFPSSSLTPRPSSLATYNDHRMAMSFAPLALLGEIKIENPSVVEKSFPHFWEELKRLGFDLKTT